MRMNRTMPEKLKNISRVNLRMRQGAVVFGDIVYEPGGDFGPRIQWDYQLVAMHSGSLDLRLDGGEIHVGAGQAVLLAPRHREHFLFSKTRQTHHGWCAIDAAAVPPALRRQLKNLRGPVPFAGSLSSLFQAGRVRAAAGNDALSSGFYLGLGLALLCDFALAAREGESRKIPGARALARMEDFICNEYGGSLSLGDLSRAAGVSRQHLAKLCREEGIAPPMGRLYAKRLEKAAELLAQTGLSIGEIATHCGFANAFHFSRKFKLAHGRGPLAWRKLRWAAGREN
jgi:AraC family transcriptional regulator of arabinose operon